MCRMLYWNTIENTCQSWPTSCRNESPFCCQYRMICFTRLLIRQSYHCATYFDRVLLQLVGTDIVNTLFKYRISLRHLTFMTETFELLMKSCAKFDLSFMNIQCVTARSLEKVKWLYLLNHPSYWNKIRWICCENTHVQSLKVWLKSVLPWLNYSIFIRDCFFICAPCISVCNIGQCNEK